MARTHIQAGTAPFAACRTTFENLHYVEASKWRLVDCKTCERTDPYDRARATHVKGGPRVAEWGEFHCPACDLVLGARPYLSCSCGWEHPELQPRLCCPACHSTEITECAEWEAKSLDDGDNTATLTEYQCRDCSKSFWR
jgi:hypothetical protein